MWYSNFNKLMWISNVIKVGSTKSFILLTLYFNKMKFIAFTAFIDTVNVNVNRIYTIRNVLIGYILYVVLHDRPQEAKQYLRHKIYLYRPISTFGVASPRY